VSFDCKETCKQECDAKVKAAKDECKRTKTTQTYVLFVSHKSVLILSLVLVH